MFFPFFFPSRLPFHPGRRIGVKTLSSPFPFSPTPCTPFPFFPYPAPRKYAVPFPLFVRSLDLPFFFSQQPGKVHVKNLPPSPPPPSASSTSSLFSRTNELSFFSKPFEKYRINRSPSELLLSSPLFPLTRKGDGIQRPFSFSPFSFLPSPQLRRRRGNSLLSFFPVVFNFFPFFFDHGRFDS